MRRLLKMPRRTSLAHQSFAIALALAPALELRTCADESGLPRLAVHGDVTQLEVDGRPLLLLAGELGNSTASNLDDLKVALDACRRMNLNAVMLPVYWDLIEREEGRFDFSLVRGAVDLARERQLKLVFLWFGTWKNSMSCYAPSCVKRDSKRFERVRLSSGAPQEIVSPACQAASEADARAFAELLRWTREYDGQWHTVVMVQVENEIGMIPEPRDHSDASNRQFQEQVPEALASLAAAEELGPETTRLWRAAGRKSSGTWTEMFGATPEAEEIFSAWQFAAYVERVASAGKREYPLPMFANAALVRPGYRPGQYPSAGPLPHLLQVWRAGCPSLDMYCPDVYFPNFMEWCRRYRRGANPLFIPEMAPSLRASGNAVYALSACGAIGVGPFSIENLSGQKAELLAGAYAALGGAAELIVKAQGEKTILGLSPQFDFDWQSSDEPQRGQLGGVVFQALFDRPPADGEGKVTSLPTFGPGRWEAPPGAPLGSLMILQTGPEEFVLLGMGVTVTFAPADGKGFVGLDRVQQGRYDRGQWIGGRWLNGDETHQGRHVRFSEGRWTMQRVTLYRY